MGEFKIRPFVEGRDEDSWISIANEYLGYFLGADHTPINREYVEWFKSSPWYDPSGMFVAEVRGEPAGVIAVRVERRGDELLGTISIELRLRYVGTDCERLMLLYGLDALRSRGASRARTWAVDRMRERIRLLEGEGFRRVRTFSVMRMRLNRLRRGIGENTQVRLRPARTECRDDIETLTSLVNAAFEGQFGFRPTTVEENEAWLRQPNVDLHCVLAYLEDRPVGYIVVADRGLTGHRRVGEVSSVGVLRQYRRRGIGTALMLSGLEWLRERGVDEAVLEVDDDNPTGAMKLYGKVGFKAAYKKLVYERTLRP